MRAVIQRVSHARVIAQNEAGLFDTTGEIGSGLFVLLGVLKGDTEREAQRLVEDILHYRVFEDETGRMNLSLVERGLGLLVVSQFTLAADGRRGRRPSFDQAADPALAEPLYDCFIELAREAGVTVGTGRFGAQMRCEITGDGPATFLLQREPAPE